MPQTLQNFKRFRNAIDGIESCACSLIGVGTEYLKSAYPSTREDYGEICCLSVPDYQEILRLSADLTLSRVSDEYAEIKSVAQLMVARMISAALTFQDAKQMHTTYGYTPELVHVVQINAELAVQLHNLEIVYEQFRPLYNQDIWTFFKPITDYIDDIEASDKVARWVFDNRPQAPGEPIIAPYMHYDKMPFDLLDAVWAFLEKYPEYEILHIPNGYKTILDKNGIDWSNQGMQQADVDELDDQCVIALIIGVARAERFSEGTLAHFFDNGCMLRWLKRLKELDEAPQLEAEQLDMFTLPNIDDSTKRLKEAMKDHYRKRKTDKAYRQKSDEFRKILSRLPDLGDDCEN